MAGDMIRAWNEPVLADFNAFYLMLSEGAEEDHKSLTISCLWNQF
jgi:tRNA U34 5-methylaminomethyl-2-thiouridine-forming methyltransferase MnmC